MVKARVEMIVDSFSQKVSKLSEGLEELQAEFMSNPANAPEILSDALESLHACIEDLQVAENVIKRQNEECIKSVEESTDALALAHELQVHQIELEMQNEELKRAKLEMNNALAKYSDLYDFAPIGLFTLDENRNILEINVAGAELLGMKKSDLLNRRFELFIAEEDHQSFVAFSESAFRTSAKQTCELMLLKNKGPKIYANIDGAATEDTSINEKRIRIAITDITERKRYEKALRERGEKFRLVADFAYDWETWLDTKGNYIYVSPSCERITGYSAEDFMKDPRLDRDIIHPDDKAAIEDFISHQSTGKTGPRHVDFRIVTAQGEIKWISHLCQPVFDKNGKWLGRRGSNRDITERKAAEEGLMEARDNLEIRAKERTAELEQINAQLQMEMAERSEAEKALKALSSYNRSLIEASLDPLVTIGPDGEITDVNAATESATGYRLEELVGRDFSDYFTEPDKADLGINKFSRKAMCVIILLRFSTVTDT